jgi:hypothetical protein
VQALAEQVKAIAERSAVPPQGLDIIRDEQGRMIRVLPPQQQVQ